MFYNLNPAPFSVLTTVCTLHFPPASDMCSLITMDSKPYGAELRKTNKQINKPAPITLRKDPAGPGIPSICPGWA